MSRFKRSKNKSNKKSSISINERISLLNKELKKTGMISEVMNTSNVYSTSTFVPPTDPVDFFVPDTSGATGDDFTPPVSGDPDDPSNWPDAYTNDDWMFNPNEVDGESNRPIPASVDPAVIAAYNTAFPDDGRFPAGGGGIVFGDSGFGTGVGYAKGGHFYQVLNPGLFGNGSTKIVPPDAEFGAPWFGLFGMYFPATPELAEVIKAMSKAYANAGGYNPQGAMRISLWRNHNLFHDGPYNDFAGKKYTDSEGRLYVLQTFFMHRAPNLYKSDPSRPATTTNPVIRGFEDEPIYPGPIPPGGLFPPLSDPAYDFLRRKTEEDLLALFGFGRKPKPIYYGGQRGEDLRNLKKDIDLFNKMSPLGGGPGGVFKLSHVPEGDLLSEAVKLGYFEPVAMNVDLADIRKGVMPEYPNKPPAEMIDGYHKDSKLRPKEFRDKYQLKLDKNVLIRNHRLKKEEIDVMVNTVNKINEYLKKNPGDLIYAQQRYPVDDQRLAVLNWKMDQMLDAGKEYLDNNFKENQTLYKRATDRTKKNIKLTDPKYVQQHYDELRGTIKSKPRINRKSPSRFFKKEKKKSSMDEINDKIKQLDKDLLI